MPLINSDSNSFISLQVCNCDSFIMNDIYLISVVSSGKFTSSCNCILLTPSANLQQLSGFIVLYDMCDRICAYTKIYPHVIASSSSINLTSICTLSHLNQHKQHRERESGRERGRETAIETELKLLNRLQIEAINSMAFAAD